jgi:cation/acetate symporter
MEQRHQIAGREFARAFGLFTAAFLACIAIVVLLAEVGLSPRALGIVLGGVVVLAFLAIGLLVRTMRRTDFQFGGRNVPPVHNGMSMAAAYLGAAGVAGLTGAFFVAGPAALAFLLGGLGGFVLLTVLIGPYYRNAGVATVPDLLAIRFRGSLMGFLAPLIVLACSFGLFVVEVRMVGNFGAGIFGVPITVAIAGGLAVILLTTIFGGMRSLTTSGIAQYIVLIVAFLVPLVVFSTQKFAMPLPFAALGAALHRLADIPDGAAARLAASAIPGRLLPTEGFDGLNFVLIIVTLSAGIAVLPHVVMRSAPTVDIQGARRSSAWGLFFVLVVLASAPVYATFAGLALLDIPAGAAAPAVPGADSIVQSFPAIAGLPQIFTALIAVGALSASLAAAASLLFVIGSTLGHDLYPRLFDRNAPTGRRLIAIRLMMIATAGLAGWIALDPSPRYFAIAAGSASIAAAGLFPAVFLAIWWRRCTSLGALSGMICGVALTLFYLMLVEFGDEKPWSFFGLSGTAVPGFAAGAFGLPVGLAVAILVSIATPAEPERHAAIDRIRRPDAGGTFEPDD